MFHILSDWLVYFNLTPAILLSTIAIPALATAAVIVLNRVLGRLQQDPGPRIPLTPHAVQITARVLAALLWTCAGFMLLSAWGVGVGGLWTVLVSIITAVGVGFLAVWTMISNITASLFITIWRPFHFGETIEILPEGLRGRVTDRNLMFTTMREAEGTILHIPNNFFFQKMFRVDAASRTGARVARSTLGETSHPLTTSEATPDTATHPRTAS